MERSSCVYIYKQGLNGFSYFKTEIVLLLQILKIHLKLHIQECIKQMVQLLRDRLKMGRPVKSNG